MTVQINLAAGCWRPMDNWRGALKQIYRLPEGRNTVRRCPSMRTELRRGLHWKEEGALVMCHEWEGKR